MDVLKLSTDWAHAEVFSAKIAALIGLLFFMAAIGFWQLGKTVMANAFVWPLLIAGGLIFTVSAGLYFTNKPRISQFEKAYKHDTKAFVKTEIERTSKSQKELALVFKILPCIIIAAALLIMFTNTPMWRATGITIMALMIILLLIDSNTNARNTAYHQALKAITL